MLTLLHHSPPTPSTSLLQPASPHHPPRSACSRHQAAAHSLLQHPHVERQLQLHAGLQRLQAQPHSRQRACSGRGPGRGHSVQDLYLYLYQCRTDGSACKARQKVQVAAVARSCAAQRGLRGPSCLAPLTDVGGLRRGLGEGAPVGLQVLWPHHSLQHQQRSHERLQEQGGSQDVQKGGVRQDLPSAQAGDQTRAATRAAAITPAHVPGACARPPPWRASAAAAPRCPPARRTSPTGCPPQTTA